MSEAKEFLGKTLDAAIAEACAFYDVPREKLEIDIIEDAKSGIFGIVGARKARIRARLATLPDFMQNASSGSEQRPEGKRRRSRREKSEAPEQVEVQAQPEMQDVPSAASEENELRPPLSEELPAETPDAQPQDEAPRGRRPRQARQARVTPHRLPKAEKGEKNEEIDATENVLPIVPLTDLNQETLLTHTRDVIGHLVAPVLDVLPEQVDLSIEINEDRVQVSIKSEETGLLIGRDGQNLAAVQYLASRMVTRVMGSQVRVQVDAGDYHMRQDSRLQELALSLAEKVKATGKVQTTRPLSAYQRRVIHLALQDDPEIQTRSSGEGALKHVVILRRKD